MALRGSDGVSRRGDDRSAVSDLARFFSNPFLSDVSLMVDGRSFHAHKLVLAKSSVVFERMFSPDWHRASNQILELGEESMCAAVFDVFLRFLYCNEVQLHADLALPLLVLADKYDVASLQRVCVNFVLDDVLPEMSEKEVFHVWFQYSLKAGHPRLLARCVRRLADCMSSIVDADDWADDFSRLDADQLCALLQSHDLKVKDEKELWDAVVRWLNAQRERLEQAEELLPRLLALIHFPMMSAAQLTGVEEHALAKQHAPLVQPLIRQAYKYHALPLSLRLTNADLVDAAGAQLLVRCYSEVRWERRLVVTHFSQLLPGTEVTYRFHTRACAVPPAFWDWELKLLPRGTLQQPEDARCQLVGVSVLLESQARSIEYLVAVVRNAGVVRSVSGRRTVSRSKPVIEVEFGQLGAAMHDSVEYDCVALQLMIRPAE